MAIYTRNYDGFGVFVCFLRLVRRFSDVPVLKSDEEKDTDRERLMCKYKMKQVQLWFVYQWFLVHFTYFCMANGRVRCDSNQGIDVC